jgi:hypothetical protein
MGAEQPFAGRLRVGSTVRLWQQDFGSTESVVSRLREIRFDVSSSWSPNSWLSFSLNLPLQAREWQDVNLSKDIGLGPGDLEVAARVVVFGAERMRPPLLLSVLGGVRLPTAPLLRDQDGRVLSTEGQLGTGATTPVVGLGWSGFFSERWSALATLTGEWPLGGRLELGPSAAAVVMIQFQPRTWLGVRSGLDGRAEGAPMSRQRPRAGVLLSVLGDVVLGLGGGAAVSLGVRVPIFESREGVLRTWPLLVASLVVDV